MTKPTRPRMGELERAVMDLLWAGDAAEQTVREVHHALAAERDIAYTTVMTVLDRLAKKGLVEQRRDGRAYRYAAAGSREALTADLMRATLEEFAVDDRRAALVRFVDGASDDELAALREALGRLEGR